MSKQRLESALRQFLTPPTITGKLGYVVNGSATVQTSDPAQYNVRLDDGRYVTAYHDYKVSPDFDRPVNLRAEVRDGKLVFIILGMAGGVTGGNPGIAPHSHSRTSGMYFEVDTWLLSGFRVTVHNGLELRVGPGWYWYKHERHWFTGKIIDVSGEVPGTANEHRWTVIHFDPSDESFSLTSTTPQSVTQELLEQEISMTDSYDIASVRLVNGMTTIPDSYVVDLRFTLGGQHVYAATTLTISSGAVAGGLGSYFIVAAESGTSDDLDTLTLTGTPRLIILQADTGDTITLKHSTGSFEFNSGGDIILTGDKTIVVFWDGTNAADIGSGASVDLPNFGTSATKTLSAGAASAGSDRHLVLAAESGTADDLLEITGLSIGDEVIIRADAGDTITVKHDDAGATDKILLYNTGDLALTGDQTLKLVKIESGKVVQYVDTKSALSGGGSFPKRADMWHYQSLVTVGNALTTDNAVADTYSNVRTYQNAPANGDTFTHGFLLADGMYTLNIGGIKAGSHGKVDWYVDNVLQGTQDWYFGSQVNEIKTLSITVVGDGWHVLKGVVNGKNAGSSNYYMVLRKFWIVPSAD
jgi:hypothetical protein